MPELKELITKLLRALAYARFDRHVNRLDYVSHGTLRLIDLSENPSPNSVPAVVAALDLIKRYAPRRYAGLNRRIGRILVARIPGAHSSFMPAIRSIFIHTDIASQEPPESIAAQIIHEAAHARIWSCGYRRFDRPKRLERRANLEMLDFVSSLPDADYLIQWARTVLGRTDQADADFAQLAQAQKAELANMMPSWVPNRLTKWLIT